MRGDGQYTGLLHRQKFHPYIESDGQHDRPDHESSAGKNDIRDSPAVPDNRRNRRIVLRELFVVLQISGVEVLSSMRQEANSRHEHHNIYTPQPMVLEHLTDLVEEDAGLGLCALIILRFCLPLPSSAEEDLTLGKKRSQRGSEGRDTGRGPEQRAPGRVREEVQVDNGGDEVSDGVSLLDNAASDTTDLDGDVLKSSGGG